MEQRARGFGWAMVVGLALSLAGCGGGEKKAAEFAGFGSAQGRAPQYLTEEVQGQIRAAKGAWKGIVIHVSGGTEDSLVSLQRHHEKVLTLPEGLAWHFLIGDGGREPEGVILVGPRWLAQQPGEALETVDEAGLIQICLLGSANAHAPAGQLAGLDELLNFLFLRYGPLPVRAHVGIEPVGNDCPGDRLSPADWAQLHEVWPQSFLPVVSEEEAEVTEGEAVEE